MHEINAIALKHVKIYPPASKVSREVAKYTTKTITGMVTDCLWMIKMSIFAWKLAKRGF